MSFQGGYLLIKQPLIRSGMYAHTSADPDSVPPSVLNAVNAIQATPWRVNSWILDVMREAWTCGDNIGCLPSPHDTPPPPKLPDQDWEAMSKEARGDYITKRRYVYDENAALQGKRSAFLRKLGTAERHRDDESIWMPCYLDFRGRVYHMPQDLHPQGDDIAKALLMFSAGLPLGKSGLSWLAIRLANCAGRDKLTMAERTRWVIDNEQDIMRSGEDPFRCLWWAQFEDEEPWQLLATCREWYLAHTQKGGPEDFWSHLPVPLDGSCNGVQHLSLAGRDPIGAKATNCSASTSRYDVYMEVCDEVRRRVSLDAASGIEEAHHWLGKVTRKTVKRAVMTTPLTY